MESDFKSTRIRRIIVLVVATILSTGVVAAVTLAHDPEAGDQEPKQGNRSDRGASHDMRGDRNIEAERGARRGVGMGLAPRPDQRFKRWMPGPDEEVSDREWDQVVELLTEHSPTRLKLFEKIEAERGPDSPVVKKLKARSVGLYRMLNATREGSPRTYEFAIRQIEIEDEIIRALEALRDGDSPERRDQFNASTRKFIENNFAEREAWLKMLEESIARQRENLESDRKNIDDLTKKRSEFFEREYDRMIGRLDDEGDDRPPPPPPDDER